MALSHNGNPHGSVPVTRPLTCQLDSHLSVCRCHAVVGTMSEQTTVGLTQYSGPGLQNAIKGGAPWCKVFFSNFISYKPEQFSDFNMQFALSFHLFTVVLVSAVAAIPLADLEAVCSLFIAHHDDKEDILILVTEGCHGHPTPPSNPDPASCRRRMKLFYNHVTIK